MEWLRNRVAGLEAELEAWRSWWSGKQCAQNRDCSKFKQVRFLDVDERIEAPSALIDKEVESPVPQQGDKEQVSRAGLRSLCECIAELEDEFCDDVEAYESAGRSEADALQMEEIVEVLRDELREEEEVFENVPETSPVEERRELAMEHENAEVVRLVCLMGSETSPVMAPGLLCSRVRLGKMLLDMLPDFLVDAEMDMCSVMDLSSEMDMSTFRVCLAEQLLIEERRLLCAEGGSKAAVRCFLRWLWEKTALRYKSMDPG